MPNVCICQYGGMPVPDHVNWIGWLMEEGIEGAAERVREHKFWVSVSRVDNAYGDKNLMCSCLPVESEL